MLFRFCHHKILFQCGFSRHFPLYHLYVWENRPLHCTRQPRIRTPSPRRCWCSPPLAALFCWVQGILNSVQYAFSEHSEQPLCPPPRIQYSTVQCAVCISGYTKLFFVRFTGFRNKLFDLTILTPLYPTYGLL